MALHNASAISGSFEPGLRALGGKGEGRIIVFHADAEDFLGSVLRGGNPANSSARRNPAGRKNGPE